MKYLSLFLLLAVALFADEQQPEKAHLVAEAQSKQALVDRLQNASMQLTENQKLYDAIFYSLDLFPDVTSKTLYGDVSMTAVVLENGLDAVDLNLFDNMVVDSVFFDGVTVAFTHVDDVLTVNAGRTIGAGESFTTRIVYHGKPSQSGFGAFGFSSHAGKPMVWTLSEPYGARNWWPCKDAPVDKADSVDIKVTVRSDLIVASNGSLKEVTESDGLKTYWWQERYPIVTYLVSLAIHPYYTYSDWYVTGEQDSMEVQYYVFPNDVAWAKSQNAKTVNMIEVFSDIFGEYPFLKEKYGHAQFLWGGGMEHQTITSLGGYSESLIAHELAHQWWGDMVTCEDFHHIWLNEGFATYSEALWWESQYGEAALHQDMSHNVYLGSETVYVEHPETDNIFNYQTTYAKASWVLHMLRHVVGDDIFWEILQTYYTDFKFQTVTTEQFRDLCERISGQELDAFFDQWIYKGGAPFYEFLWWSEKAEQDGKWRVSGIIRQIQSSHPVFEMPVDITVAMSGGEETFVVQNDRRDQEFEFLVDAEPTTVTFDKKNWILKQVSEILQPVFHIKDITITDKNDDPAATFFSGDEGHIYFTVQNFGVAARNITAVLNTSDPDITFTSATVDIDELGAGEDFQNDSPFVFRITENANSHLAALELEFTPTSGAQKPFTFHLPIGTPTLLIVDDDSGADYEDYYERMAVQAGEVATTWSIKNSGLPALDALSAFDYVVWFTGDDSTTSLTKDEQGLVAEYMAAGGCLLLTGQHIGYDLVQDGDDQDAQFFTNTLKASHVPGVISDIAVVGIPGDPLGDGLAVRFEDLGDGPENQNSLRQLDPIEPAAGSFLFLPSRKSAGIRLLEPTGAKLVYLAFGLEGIEGPKETSAGDFLKKVILWFDLSDAVHDNAGNTMPKSFVLENYPNPFNPKTTIQFYNPERGHVQLLIYNALGQKVRQLHDGMLDSGWHFMSWDGRMDDGADSASGVYFVKINQKNENKWAPQSVKMLKLN